MKNKFITAVSLIIGGILFTACEPEENVVSTISSFEDYTVNTSSVTTFGNVDEEDATYTVKFLLEENKNINDVSLQVSVSPSSTATEGVDFELSTHSIPVLALWSDSISVDVTILNDLLAEEDETIYLILEGGLGQPRPIEVQVGTILANEVKYAPDIDFTLRWEFDNEVLASSTCEIVEDLDLVINTAFAYAGDLLGNDAATLSCPESGTLSVEDLPADGSPYYIIVIFWAGVDMGDLGNDMTLFLDYHREGSIDGTIEMSGFTSTDSGVGYAPLTIERTGDVVTIRDGVSGDVVIEGGAHLDFGDVEESLTKMENIPLK